MRPMGNIPNVTPGITKGPVAVVVAAAPVVDTDGTAVVVAVWLFWKTPVTKLASVSDRTELIVVPSCAGPVRVTTGIVAIIIAVLGIISVASSHVASFAYMFVREPIEASTCPMNDISETIIGASRSVSTADRRMGGQDTI